MLLDQASVLSDPSKLYIYMPTAFCALVACWFMSYTSTVDHAMLNFLVSCITLDVLVVL